MSILHTLTNSDMWHIAWMYSAWRDRLAFLRYAVQLASMPPTLRRQTMRQTLYLIRVTTARTQTSSTTHPGRHDGR